MFSPASQNIMNAIDKFRSSVLRVVASAILLQSLAVAMVDGKG